MKVNTEQSVPIKMWLDYIEEGAMAQARRLAQLPFVFSHVAIMPDAHLGYGMPIGGVLATRRVVIPNAVGVDIGCGMLAMKTSLNGVSDDELKSFMQLTRARVPVGFKHHSTPRTGMPVRENKSLPVVDREFNKARKSLGTLGGGNHFIEFQEDDDGFLWVMIHSGSRNLGKQVADYYNTLAKELNAEWFSKVPLGYDLAFLPLDTDEGEQYLREMNYCVHYAFANRMAMLNEVRESIQTVLPTCVFDPPINIAHNYARIENHFGKNVVVHRKGATSARKDEVGVIPGSQGTASYIVKGLGNPQSFNSCSHGAGRKMGRKQASRELDLEEQQAILDDQGIIHGIRRVQDLDEAPGAYKDIDEVMRHQRDLVKVIVRLQPRAVIKG